MNTTRAAVPLYPTTAPPATSARPVKSRYFVPTGFPFHSLVAIGLALGAPVGLPQTISAPACLGVRRHRLHPAQQ